MKLAAQRISTSGGNFVAKRGCYHFYTLFSRYQMIILVSPLGLFTPKLRCGQEKGPQGSYAMKRCGPFCQAMNRVAGGCTGGGIGAPSATSTGRCTGGGIGAPSATSTGRCTGGGIGAPS